MCSSDLVDRRTKDGKAAYEAFTSSLQPGVTVLSAEEAAESLLIASAAKGCITRHGFKFKATELMFLTTYMEANIKAAIDAVGEDGYLYDLKTTAEEATAKGFGRNLIWSDDYKLQAAWYMLLWKLNFGERPKGFRFVVVEKEPPFLTAVFEMHPDLIAEGETLMLSAIKSFEVCKSFNEWPSYPTEVITIARPQSTAPMAPINFA